MTELNERIARTLELGAKHLIAHDTWKQALNQYLAAERQFREAWNDLTPEEQAAINEVTP